MKKKAAVTLIVALVIALSLALSGSAFAGEQQGMPPKKGARSYEAAGQGVGDYQQRQGYYIDNDGDGICDYYGTGQGACYIDQDGDGICDNFGNNVPAYGGGRVNAGIGNSRPGTGYVDANNDGVCDNRGSGFGARSGQGAGRFANR